eukprot:maker-scaffold_25-snap-gene-2.4-mRNA-1 protein AED:0.16 eAED:0.16 QI:72/1/1/1/1/1/2/50/451
MPRKTSRKSKSGRRKRGSKSKFKSLDNDLRVTLTSEAAKLKSLPSDALFVTETSTRVLSEREQIIQKHEKKLQLKRERAKISQIKLSESRSKKFKPLEGDNEKLVTKKLLDKYQLLSNKVTERNLEPIKKLVISKLEGEEEKKQTPKAKIYDLWASDSQVDSKSLKIHSQKNKVCPRMPRTLKHEKKLSLVSVKKGKIPHPGASVNPMKEDIIQGMEKVVELEQPNAIEKKENKALYDIIQRQKVPEPTKLFIDDEESEKEEDEEEEVFQKDPSRPVTRKQRRKRKIQKLKELEQQKQKKQKKQLASAMSLSKGKKIDKEFAKLAKEKELQKEEKQKLIQQTEKNRREDVIVYEENGIEKEEERNIPVVLPSDLRDGKLRTIIPHGGLWKDQWFGLREKNILATGVRKQTKSKVKVIAVGENFTDKNHLIKAPTEKGSRSKKAVFIRPKMF